MGGDRAYITTLLVALAVLCLVVVAARWVQLARRVPLDPLPISAAAPANRAVGDPAGVNGSAAADHRAAGGKERAAAKESGSQGQAGQPVASSGSPSSRAGSADSRPAKLPTAQSKLELNSATAAQLELLPGIGPTLAQRIVDYRKQHGLFKRVEELLNVNGIGEHKLAEIRELVYVKPA